MKAFNAIRWKILAPFLLLTLAASVLAGWLMTGYARQLYLDDLRSGMEQEADLIAGVIGLDVNAPLAGAELGESVSRIAGHLNARVTVIAADGAVLADSEGQAAEMENHLERPEIRQAQEIGSGSSIRFSHTVGYEMLYTAVVVRVGGRENGYVRVAKSLQEIEQKISNLQRWIALSTLLITVLMILVSVLISYQISRPLSNLTQAVEGLVPGLEQDKDKVTSGDEIARLTHSFTLMASQIELQIQDLESGQARLEAVLRAMTEGVLIVDSRGMVQMANPAAMRLFNRSEGTAAGIPLVEFTQEHQVVGLWRKSSEGLESLSSRFELVTLKKNILASAAPFGQSLPGSTLLLIQDISSQVQVESMRRDFISNVSHELRTPLAGIKALAETLQDGALEDPPAARKFLERIQVEVDALNLMVAELLELSRIESGKVPLELKKTMMGDIIGPAFDRLSIQADRAGLSLSLDLPPDLPDVLADANRMQQVVVNLMHNAIKFTSQGGQVLVKAWRNGNVVEVIVQDTGKGIPAADLPRIFERFYKVDRSRSGGGTGLGLAIARHMVEAHGGKIWAESMVGKGSTFHFTIPITG